MRMKQDCLRNHSLIISKRHKVVLPVDKIPTFSFSVALSLSHFKGGKRDKSKINKIKEEKIVSEIN